MCTYPKWCRFMGASIIEKRNETICCFFFTLLSLHNVHFRYTRPNLMKSNYGWYRRKYLIQGWSSTLADYFLFENLLREEKKQTNNGSILTLLRNSLCLTLSRSFLLLKNHFVSIEWQKRRRRKTKRFAYACIQLKPVDHWRIKKFTFHDTEHG